MNKSQKKYQGIITPMVTPLVSLDELDLNGLERLVDHIISGGVHGLFILGTSGEAQSLSYSLRRDLIKRVCEQVNNRVPVLVGVTDTSLKESLLMASAAKKYNADAIVAAPPYYFFPNQQELVDYFSTLADSSPLPLLLYNMPSHTKVHFEPKTVLNLSRHKNIIGLKDSSGNIIYFQKVLNLLNSNPEFSVLVGPEEMLMHTTLSGGDGGVCGGSNLFPNLFVRMYEAAVNQNLEVMNHLQQKIMNISSRLYGIGNSSASFLQGLKCSLSEMGICNDALAAPFQSFTGSQKEAIQKALNSMNIEGESKSRSVTNIKDNHLGI